MVSAIAISALGAFEATLSVLLTLSYGVLAARLKLFDSRVAKQVSVLCVKMFLPALLITKVGSEMKTDNARNYIPIFIWATIYCIISMVMAKIAAKLFNLPSWVAPACAFNNTTSLPLLLTKSLTQTGILRCIAGGDVAAAVERAQSYFLINSMVSKAATFAVGPKLLWPEIERERNEHPHQQNNNSSHAPQEVDESTSLLPKPITTRIAAAEEEASYGFHHLPWRVQRTLRYIMTLINPTLWGAVIAVVIGLTPALHKIFFAKTTEGGWLNAWFTSSLRNIGDLFTGLQMFVVGSRLSDSFTLPRGAPKPNPPTMAVVVIFVIRFVFWGAVSIPIIYLLAARTNLLGGDPILWWTMMLMPVGPPAMLIASLVEVAGVGHHGKMMVARTLSYAYFVTPMMFLAVVGALKACEKILEDRGQKPCM